MTNIHFGTLRTNDAINEAGAFTGEGVSEVEGLMRGAGVNDIIREEFRTGETTWVITRFYSLRGCTYL